MDNPYQPQLVKITGIQSESAGIKRFKLSSPDFSYSPGQIIFLSIPGFGEAPFAPCNPPDSEYLELCVRNAGKFTEKLHSMKSGDEIGIRGPQGHGWPVKNFQFPISNFQTKTNNSEPLTKNLLIVVGGLGLVPLRALIWGKDKFLEPGAKIQIFYGAKNPREFLFHKDFAEWQKQGIDLQLTIDNACHGWDGCVGLVTKLFDEHEIVANASAFLCGPPIMYKFVLEKLKEKKFPEEDICLSLERRMHCGVGVCQHCAVGSLYTCKDGPVFKYADIKNIPGAI
jgi:NAD(P)H-flavin reductase